MDAKSLAKSKRAHSQHHSKNHRPHQTPKGPSSSSVEPSSTSKVPTKEISEKPNQSQGSRSLPSNWDRYVEDYDSGTENPSQDRMSVPSDIVLPKSKAAEYTHLIFEAKSQYQTSSSSEIFPSFDDVLTDCDQGVGSFLSVRGESILSWIQGDNFLVEDKATASHEASFLSLDLHALAEQLAKVDLSKRLFLEADLLSFERDQATRGNEAADINLVELPASGLPDGDKPAVQYCEVVSSVTTSRNQPAQKLPYEGPESNQVKYQKAEFSRADKSTVLQPTVTSTVNSLANTNEKQSRFEAEAAEAELDMLLGSFSETNFLDSSSAKEQSSYTAYVSKGQTSPASLRIASNQSVPILPVETGPDLSRSPIAADLDDTLDDLLKETSSLMIQNGASLSSEVKANPLGFQSSSSSHPSSNSKLLDDFDSWLDTI